MKYLCVSPEKAKEMKELYKDSIERTQQVLKENGKVLFPLKSNHSLPDVEIVELDFSPQTGQPTISLPSAYEAYSPSLLVTEEYSEAIYKALCMKHSCKYVLLKQRINRLDIRGPQTRLLYSTESNPTDEEVIASVKQNSCWYKWYPLHSMFCRGNIPEKIRMSQLVLREDELVLDLYAGIGYWTIPLLKRNEGVRVIACDMNAWSVKALRENLLKNKVSERCIVLEGDNAMFQDVYSGKCDRVLLGLLPSSQRGWPLAISALKECGGVLHIHENVPKAELDQFQEHIKTSLDTLWRELRNSECRVTIKSITCVKSYSPKVYHYVFDVQIAH